MLVPVIPSIGPYEIVSELARGGMGVIYRAIDGSAGREVAIKVLLASNDAQVQVQRFVREARALAKLGHPGIVGVHTVGEAHGRPYMVMELLDGEPLDQQLGRDGPLPCAEAAEVTRKLAVALAYAHEHGVLHRDLKPANVMMCAGEPKLVDFGLAKDVDSRSRLTKTGRMMGTPGFWAPEQARGDSANIGVRSDVYGLGATLYALLTGEPPYNGESLLFIMAAMERGAVEAPSRVRPDVDPRLDALCLKCLERDPADRYPSAGSVAEDLASFLAGGTVDARAPTTSRRLLRWVRRQGVLLGLLAVSCLALSGALFMTSEAENPKPSGNAPGRPAEDEPESADSAAVARAQRLLGQRRHREGLAALEHVAALPSELVWSFAAGVARSGLGTGELEEALATFDDPRVQAALARTPPAVEAERLELASRAVTDACALHGEPLAALPRERLERMVDLARLGVLLAGGRPIEDALVEPLVQLFTARLGFDQLEENLLLADLALSVVELSPTIERHRELVTVGTRGLKLPTKARLLPVVRRLAKLDPTPRNRFLEAAALIELEDDSSFALAAELLESGVLTPTDASELYRRRARVYRQRSDYAAALQDQRRVAELAPQNLSERVVVGEILQLLDRNAEARDVARETLGHLPWQDGARLYGPRDFQAAVELLWRAGGRTAEAQLMTKTTRRVLTATEPADRVVWNLRCALLELDGGDEAEAGRRLRAAAESLAADAGPLEALAAEVRTLAEAGPVSVANTDAVAELVQKYERLQVGYRAWRVKQAQEKNRAR